MFGLLQPWWLIALAVIPLIRWLHRRQAPLLAHAVSAIFLWQVEATEDAPGRVQRPPDPAWRRRAFIAALLITALAAPTIEREHTTLTVWLDDSLSMLTIENGETRIAAGRRQLAEELQDSSYDEIITRSLSETFPRKLDDDSAHWLVTDGASEQVREWAGQVQVDRVIHVGTETENVAVTRLAARRVVDDDNAFDLLVSISNTGIERAERRLGATTITLEPGETIHTLTRIPATDGTIEISIDARDALANDDSLALPAGALSLIRTTVEPQCARALRTAIEQHPGLEITDTAAAELEVSCPQGSFPDIELSGKSVGRIRVLVGAATVRAVQGRDTTPVWLPHEHSAGRLYLPTEFIASAAWPGQIDATRQRVLLLSGGLPLIVVTKNADDTTATVDTVIDMHDAAFVRQPEYAALLAILVDVASGRQVLDATMGESRTVADSVIRPAKIEIDFSDSPGASRAVQEPLSWLFVLIALLVLAIDIALLVVARRRVAYA